MKKITKKKFPISIYIHWPFCAKRCDYCAFNTYVKKSVTETEMTKMLLKTISNQIQKIKQSNKTPFQISSIFFGGGTPRLNFLEKMKKIFLSFF